jgi:hypothetical protein
MLDAVKAVQKSTSKLRKLQQGANHLQSGSEAGTITGGHQGGFGQAKRIPSYLGEIPAMTGGNLEEVGDETGPTRTEAAMHRVLKVNQSWEWNRQGGHCQLLAPVGKAADSCRSGPGTGGAAAGENGYPGPDRSQTQGQRGASLVGL